MYKKFHKKLVLAVVFFCGLTFFSSFWPNFPFNDHIIFIQHLPLFENVFDWLKFCYSYTRERIFHPGDLFLFRPATHLILGLASIVSIEFSIGRGLTIYGFLFLNILLLFRLFQNSNQTHDIGQCFKSITLAVMASISFSGLLAITWWHISPYLLGNAIFLYSYLLLFQPFSLSQFTGNAFKNFSIFICFLISYTINEIYFVSSLIFLLTLFVFQKLYRPIISSLQLRLLIKLTAIAATVYLTLNLLDAISHYEYVISVSLLNHDSFPMGTSFIKYVGALFDVALLSIATLYEATINHLFLGSRINDFTEFAPISLGESPKTITSIGGLLIFISVFLSILLSKNSSDQQKVFSILSFAVLVSIIFSLSIFRVIPRGLEYLHHASYYWWYTSFWIIVLVSLWIINNEKKRSLLRLKNTLFLVIFFFKVSALFAIALQALPAYQFSRSEHQLKELQNLASSQTFLLGKPPRHSKPFPIHGPNDELGFPTSKTFFDVYDISFMKQNTFISFQPVFDLDPHTFIELNSDRNLPPININNMPYGITSYIPFLTSERDLKGVRIFHGNHGHDSKSRAPEQIVFLFKDNEQNKFLCSYTNLKLAGQSLWSIFTWQKEKLRGRHLNGIIFLSNRPLMRIYDILPITNGLSSDNFGHHGTTEIKLSATNCL